MTQTFTIQLNVTRPVLEPKVRKVATKAVKSDAVKKSPAKAKKAKAKKAAAPKAPRKPRTRKPLLGSWIVTGAGQQVRVSSPSLSGEEGIAEARKMVADLVAAGCTVDFDGGLNVRVSPGEMTAGELSKVAINHLWFEGFLDAAMPESRRASNNQTAKSNRAFFGGAGTEALNRGIAAIAASKDHAQLVAAFQDGADYKLNLQAFTEAKAIEFRQHGGTADGEAIEHWLRLTGALVDKARTSRPRPRKTEKEWSATEEMQLFFSMFDLPKATRDFYAAAVKANTAKPVIPAVPARPQSLIGFLRAAGGLRDSGGELAARDLNRQFPGLMNNKSGMSLDRAREMAAEAGYLGANTEEAVAETLVNDLLEAIDRHPVYSIFDEDTLAKIADAEAAREEHFEQQAPAFEPGAEGLPQQLISGVAPVTDRDRMEMWATKPLRGGNAPVGGIFDGGLPADIFADCPF